MKKYFVFLFLIFCIIRASSVFAFKAEISADRFSLEADRVHLQDILQYLSDRGIRVYIDPQINPKITANFKDRDIKRGIETILKSINHILIWKSVEGPFGSLNSLKEVHIFEPGRKEMARPLNAAIREIFKDNVKGVVFIKNEILLRLKDKINLSDFKRFLREAGAVVADVNEATGVYRLILPEDADVLKIIEEINSYPGIEKAEPNYAYSVPPPFTNHDTFVYSKMSSDTRFQKGVAPVAVIDTGLARDSEMDEYILTSFDSIDPEAAISDSLGHGTQMAMIAAGIISPAGVSKEMKNTNPVIPIRAFDENGYLSNFDLMKSVDFAIENGARVLSLSWGTETESGFLKDNLDHAAAKGIIIVASAGNEPTGKNMYPAAYSSVIGVGALDAEGNIWEKSNYGDFVTVYAPGVASFPIGYRGDPGAYAGTSISAAFVANMIAGYLSDNPDASINEILESLTAKESAE